VALTYRSSFVNNCRLQTHHRFRPGPGSEIPFHNILLLEIAAHGARLRGLPPLTVGAVLLLECGGRSARYCVVWMGDPKSQYEGHIGLASLDLDKHTFGIEPTVAGSFRNEYNRLEAEVRRSEDRYRTLFENSPGMIYKHDMRGLLLSLEPSGFASTRLSVRRRIGKKLG
jgi:PAS domain-containing protein